LRHRDRLPHVEACGQLDYSVPRRTVLRPLDRCNPISPDSYTMRVLKIKGFNRLAFCSIVCYHLMCLSRPAWPKGAGWYGS
jgi:hypothetical protein